MRLSVIYSPRSGVVSGSLRPYSDNLAILGGANANGQLIDAWALRVPRRLNRRRVAYDGTFGSLFTTPPHVRPVGISRWGRDHFSTLLYLESRCVDNLGKLKIEHMRCDPALHPGWAHRATVMNDLKGCSPTRLRGGVLLPGHDDWNCVDDMIHEGLVRHVPAPGPVYALTERGWVIASALRMHRAQGARIDTFEPTRRSIRAQYYSLRVLEAVYEEPFNEDEKED